MVIPTVLHHVRLYAFITIDFKLPAVVEIIYNKYEYFLYLPTMAF